MAKANVDTKELEKRTRNLFFTSSNSVRIRNKRYLVLRRSAHERPEVKNTEYKYSAESFPELPTPRRPLATTNTSTSAASGSGGSAERSPPTSTSPQESQELQRPKYSTILKIPPKPKIDDVPEVSDTDSVEQNEDDSERLESDDIQHPLEENLPNPVKNKWKPIKKIPLQTLGVKGKFFHLLYIDKKPAVIAKEFFNQFVHYTNPKSAVRMVEKKHKVFYYLDKNEYPEILKDLEKIDVFHGSLPSTAVFEGDKIRVLDVAEIRESLRILRIKNTDLMRKLKKVEKVLSS